MNGKIRSLMVLLVVAVCLVVVAGCGQTAREEGPTYVDEQAIQAMADGLTQRFEKSESSDSNDPDEIATLIDAELDQLNKYKDGPFENSKLQETYLSYINTLEDMKDILPLMNSNYSEFFTKWQELYNKRCDLLKTFVDEYDLTVSDEYQSIMDELLANGDVVQENNAQEAAVESLVSSMNFEKTDDSYGLYTYSCVVENTTEYDFDSFMVQIALYDADGVKVEEQWASTDNWAKGEKVKFEFMTDVDAQQTKATADFYEIA